MQVMSENDNKLMKRKEAWILVDHSGKPTPTRKDIIKEVAGHFKAPEDAVIIDKIFSESGKASSKVKALVYPKAADIPKDKLNKMKIRMKLMKKGEEDKPAEQAKSAEDSGETKAEDKKAEASEKPAEEAKPQETKTIKKGDGKPAESEGKEKSEEKKE